MKIALLDKAISIFQSTRPLRGATVPVTERLPELEISIHAPLAGRDFVRATFSKERVQFQSTRPLRGATESSYQTVTEDLFQSTRPLRGATDVEIVTVSSMSISIHAPLAGRDF